MRLDRGPHKARDDAAAVARAAALLRIGEFAFFHLAHRRWFGCPAADEEIEPAFVLYLYRGRVPSWVRHLAREVIAAGRQGRLDPAGFGARPSRPPPEDPRVERRRALFLAVVYGACFALFTLAAL